MQLSPIRAAFCHPTTVREWQPFTGSFELPTLPSIMDLVTDLLLPEYRSSVMDLPGNCAVPLSWAVYVHCYCHPDNYLAGTEITSILARSLFDDREPGRSFLNLYRVCEEFRLSLSENVRKIRNRAIHPWDTKGGRNRPPTGREFSEAIQEMRKCIHMSGKNFQVPHVDLHCDSCGRKS